MSVDMRELKESLTIEQIKALLASLGSLPPHEDGKGNLRFQTVCHHGDGFNLCYFPDSFCFHCYTHCKENFDVFELVRRSKGYDGYGDALRYVVSTLGITADDMPVPFEELETSDEWDIFDKKKAYEEAANRRAAPMPVVPEEILDYFGPLTAPEEWIADGISPEVMAYYGIRIDAGKSQIIIPHRDIGGQLVGIRCRNYDPEMLENGGKYMPVSIEGTMYAHPLGRNLYGLYQNKDTIMRLHKVLVCESEKSVMQCATMYGIGNNFCVATCGHSISGAQADLLLDIGVTELILGYDHDVDLHRDEKGNKDDATKQFEQELLDVVKPFTQYFTVEVIVDYDNILGHKHSPTDDGREKLETLMKKKVRIPAMHADVDLSKIIK